MNERPRRRYADLDEGAEYAKVSVRTLRRCVADGTLTGYRLGKRILRIDLDELDAVLGRSSTRTAGRSHTKPANAG